MLIASDGVNIYRTFNIDRLEETVKLLDRVVQLMQSDNNKRPRHYKIDETFDLYVTMFEMLTEKQNDYTLKFLSLHCNLSEHIYIDLLLAHDHNQLYDQFHLVLHNLTRSTPLGVMSTISPVEELKLADGSMKNKNFNSDNNKRPRHYKIDETCDLYVTMFEMLTEKQNDYTFIS
ncbi:hypothetical protein AGLY_017615 [Aphis glycines]|uniref:Uncharacterized protein n=1 Tax=Aphis glycines TaxID=307491 RepID=A0A6G0SUN8_APHGL|nr:hypothetical protein AGLY_017615 [Aphis glycines]